MSTPKSNRESVIEALIARGVIVPNSDSMDMSICGGRETPPDIEQVDLRDPRAQAVFDICELMGMDFFDSMMADVADGNVGPAAISRRTQQVNDALLARQIADAQGMPFPPSGN